MKVSVKDGKMCSQTMMRKRLERFGEVRIVDETNGFGLDFVEKRKSGVRNITQTWGQYLLGLETPFGTAQRRT